jgi:GNAT superfamily N-acetyltransferase
MPPALEVRLAHAQDAAEICALGHSDNAFAVSEAIRFYEPEEVRDWIAAAKDNIFLVAYAGRELAGFLYCKVMSWHWAMMDNLYVRPEHRAEGVGQALLHALRRELESRGTKYISTLADGEAARTCRFLEQQGFSRGRPYVWYEVFLSKETG